MMSSSPFFQLGDGNRFARVAEFFLGQFAFDQCFGSET